MKRQIRHQVLNNLLDAHRRICMSGDSRDIKRLTRYLFRISNQFDETVMIPEHKVYPSYHIAQSIPQTGKKDKEV